MPKKGLFKRTYPGDVANAFIRCLLCDLSLKIGTFSEADLNQAKEYFGGKCPYTGEDLGENYVLDHLVPINRNSCGLHLKGNIIATSKSANSKKSSANYIDFIHNKVEGTEAEKKARIEKIKSFVEQTGYHECNDKIKDYCLKKYEEIKDMLETAKAEIVALSRGDEVQSSRS